MFKNPPFSWKRSKKTNSNLHDDITITWLLSATTETVIFRLSDNKIVSFGNYNHCGYLFFCYYFLSLKFCARLLSSHAFSLVHDHDNDDDGSDDMKNCRLDPSTTIS